MEIEQIRNPHQLETPPERHELGDLLEGRQVNLVGRTQKDKIEKQRRIDQTDASLFDRRQQVLVGFQWTLEQIGEFDQPSVGVDQLAAVLVESEILQSGWQCGHRAIRGDLSFAGVH